MYVPGDLVWEEALIRLWLVLKLLMPRLLLDLGYEFAFVNIRGFLDPRSLPRSPPPSMPVNQWCVQGDRPKISQRQKQHVQVQLQWKYSLSHSLRFGAINVIEWERESNILNGMKQPPWSLGHLRWMCYFPPLLVLHQVEEVVTNDGLLETRSALVVCNRGGPYPIKELISHLALL